MEIVYFNDKMRRPRRILRYARWVEDDKVKLPFRFSKRDNNNMHPKNENTYKMLSHCLKAYLLMDVPEDIDYRVPDEYNIADFTFENNNLLEAKTEIENSLEYDEYYFNCFLASLVCHKSGNADKSVQYAQKGLNNYPNEEWMAFKNLTDRIMEGIVELNR